MQPRSEHVHWLKATCTDKAAGISFLLWPEFAYVCTPNFEYDLQDLPGLMRVISLTLTALRLCLVDFPVGDVGRFHFMVSNCFFLWVSGEMRRLPMQCKVSRLSDFIFVEQRSGL
jgi:hypothetical protein